MNFTCNKNDLNKGISIVQKAASVKSTLTILEGILLDVSEDEVKLTSNNLEIGIEYTLEATNKKAGSIIVNSRLFGEIIRKLPNEEIRISLKDNNIVNICCGKSTFNIKGLSSEGFPAFPEINHEFSFNIKQSLFKEMIRKTIFAVSQDENRAILTGSLLTYENGSLSLVSIDGFRMALCKNAIDYDVANFKIVIPGFSLNEISKILDYIDKDINIYLENNQILFDIGNCKIVSRLLQGEYIDYLGIVPSDNNTNIKIGTEELLEAIERAALVIPTTERKYTVNLKISNNNLNVSAVTEVGNVDENIAIEMRGEEIEISFNHQFIIDVLKNIDDLVIDVSFNSEVGPCTIRPVEGDKYIYIVLPVRR